MDTDVIKWVAAGIVFLIICSFPVLFNVFGKENRCGQTLWDKWMQKIRGTKK